MDSIPINRFADIAQISPSSLRTYIKPYSEALWLLKQRGYNFNYKVVLFLCYVLAYDVRKFYPEENEEKLKQEQTEIVNRVNEKLNCKY